VRETSVCGQFPSKLLRDCNRSCRFQRGQMSGEVAIGVALMALVLICLVPTLAASHTLASRVLVFPMTCDVA
jgi:hypothetical protein